MVAVAATVARGVGVCEATAWATVVADAVAGRAVVLLGIVVAFPAVSEVAALHPESSTTSSKKRTILSSQFYACSRHHSMYRIGIKR
jgi:hypothetical protein